MGQMFRFPPTPSGKRQTPPPWRGRIAEGPMRLVQTVAGTSVTLMLMIFVSSAAISNTPGLSR